MIARRFGALGWVAGIAAAATGLYLVSLQVAAERAKLDEVDARITATHREMRQLQTELGTRASLRQLEKWNGESLSLAAPRASQYLRADYQLAAIDRHAVDLAAPRTDVVRAAMVSASPAPAAAKLPNLERAAFAPAAKAKPPVPAVRPAAQSDVKPRLVAKATLANLLRTAALEDGATAKRP